MYKKNKDPIASVGGALSILDISKRLRAKGFTVSYWGTVVLDKDKKVVGAGFQISGDIIISHSPRITEIRSYSDSRYDNDPSKPNIFPFGKFGKGHFVTHQYGIIFNGGGLHIGFKTNKARQSFMKYFYDRRDSLIEKFKSEK